jgi:hypothetical protein
MIVRLIVKCFGKQLAIVSFLQLYGVRTALLGDPKHFLGGFKLALMVMPDFSNDIAVAIVLDDFSVNAQLSHGCSYLLSNCFEDVQSGLIPSE